MVDFLNRIFFLPIDNSADSLSLSNLLFALFSLFYARSFVVLSLFSDSFFVFSSPDPHDFPWGTHKAEWDVQLSQEDYNLRVKTIDSQLV